MILYKISLDTMKRIPATPSRLVQALGFLLKSVPPNLARMQRSLICPADGGVAVLGVARSFRLHFVQSTDSAAMPNIALSLALSSTSLLFLNIARPTRPDLADGYVGADPAFISWSDDARGAPTFVLACLFLASRYTHVYPHLYCPPALSLILLLRRSTLVYCAVLRF